MGDTHHEPADMPDDDTDWVRLWSLSQDLYSTYLAELEELLECGRAEPADLARFAERCLKSARCLSDLNARLPGLGLSLARFIELRDEAISAEQTALGRLDGVLDEDATGFGALYRERVRPSLPGPQSRELSDLVLNLSLRGLGDAAIACALDVHESWPGLVRTRTRLHAGADDVVRAHLAGNTLGEIAKETGVPQSSALRILKLIGERPHGTVRRIDARDRARTIVKLRDQGLTYKEIARRLDCSMDVVKNVLRRDRRRRYGDGR